MNHMSMISLRVLVLSVSLTLLAGEQSKAQTSLQRVRIAYSSTGVNYVDLFLAKEKGYFREEGLEPQLIQMSSNIAITANIAGELDGQAAIGSAIRAIQRGAPLRVVVVTLRRPLFWLVVRPEYRAVKGQGAWHFDDRRQPTSEGERDAGGGWFGCRERRDFDSDQ